MNFKYRRNSVLLFATAVFVGLFSFQNCAPPKMNSNFQSSTAGLELQSAPSNYAQSSGKSDGRCGTSANTCQAGQYLNVADTADQSLWRCIGTNGGSSVLCSSNFSNSPVAGICGTSRNQCMQGQLEDIPDSSNEQFWNCKGFNGGPVANCRLTVDFTKLPQDGVCGTTANSCNPGVPIDSPPDTATAQQWTCNGINGGASKICSLPIANPTAARCGATYFSCDVGTATGQTVSPLSFTWKCAKPDGTFASCSSVKPTCTLLVDGKDTQTTHYKDSYTYNVNVTNGSLPASVIVKQYGEKAALTSTVFTTDVNGEVEYPKSTPIVWTMENPGGNSAANYKRRFSILDPVSKVEICQTTTVYQTLTQACNLSFDKATYAPTDSIISSFNFAVPNQPPFAKTPGVIIWYGKKNGTPDETGLSGAFSISITGGMASRTLSPMTVGSYSRYFVAKETASSSAELCKSEPVNFTVEVPPVVTPTPGPLPGPQPAPINGVCSTTTVDICASGTFAAGTDTATEDKWFCNGSNGGTNAPCSLTKVVVPPADPPPMCNNNLKGACLVGTPSVVDRDFDLCLATWTCTNPSGDVDYCATDLNVRLCNLNNNVGGIQP